MNHVSNFIEDMKDKYPDKNILVVNLKIMWCMNENIISELC